MDITCVEIENFALEADRFYDQDYIINANKRAKEAVQRDFSVLGENTPAEFIKDLRNGKRLKGGRNGHVVSFGSVILKTGIAAGERDVDHEALVGLFGVNKLNIEAFSLVCEHIKIPIFPPGDIINNSTWISNTDMTNAVVYENITGSVSFTEYSKTCNRKQMCSSLMQTFLSLRIACREIDFTHYDLHPDNCLIKIKPLRKSAIIDGVSLICYDSPKIIDYGTAHITLNGISFGVPPWGKSKHRSYNISSYKSNPLHDVFKLTVYLYTCCSENNKEVLSSCLRFFTKEDIDTLSEKASKNYCTFPRESSIENMDSFIDHCINEFGKFDFHCEKINS